MRLLNAQQMNQYIQYSTPKQATNPKAVDLQAQNIDQLKASYAQSPEPILLPMLRICFAEFPYLHYILTRGF